MVDERGKGGWREAVRRLGRALSPLSPLTFGLCLLALAAAAVTWNQQRRVLRTLANHQLQQLQRSPALLLAVLEGDRQRLASLAADELQANPGLAELGIYERGDDGGLHLLHAEARSGATGHSPAQIEAGAAEAAGELTLPLQLPAQARPPLGQAAPAGLLRATVDDAAAAAAAVEVGGWFLFGALAITALAAFAARPQPRPERARAADPVAPTSKADAATATRELELAKDRFLSSLSHELRTPLTSIVAAAEILGSFAEGDEAARSEFAAMILLEARRLQDHVDDVLDLAKLEAHTFALQCDERDLGAIAGEAAAAVRRQAMLAGVRIEPQLPATPLLHNCDGPRLSRALRGLLANAIAQAPRDSQIDLLVRADGDHRVLELLDRGQAVAPADLLAPLDRAGHGAGLAHAGRNDGLGIALPLAVAYLRAHGGELTVSARDGGGNRLQLRLPAPVGAGSPVPTPA